MDSCGVSNMDLMAGFMVLLEKETRDKVDLPRRRYRAFAVRSKCKIHFVFSPTTMLFVLAPQKKKNPIRPLDLIEDT